MKIRLEPLDMTDDGSETESESQMDEPGDIPRSMRGPARPGYMPIRLFHIVCMVMAVSCIH